MGLLRFAYQNRVLYVDDPNFTTATLTASSAATALPVTNLLEQLRSKVWRSRSGFVVVAGWNDRIDFTEAGVARVASITPGSYQTGGAYSVVLQAAMAAAAVSNTYQVTYDTILRRFSFTRSTGAAAFNMPWASGPNAARSTGRDVGFPVDVSGSTTYTGFSSFYQGRHYVRVDLGAAYAATVSAIVGYNLSSAATVRIQSSTSAAFTTLSTNQVLVAGAADDLRIAYFTSDSKQHWRLLIEDTGNDDGFVEIGVWYLGPYTTPSIRPSINWTRERDELSTVVHAIDGAQHSDTRPVRDVWGLEWLEAVEADVVILEAVADAMPPGRNFFVTFDADDPANDTQYGYFAGNMTFSFAPYNYWTVEARFVEALG
jgi:hypothetical protein